MLRCHFPMREQVWGKGARLCLSKCVLYVKGLFWWDEMCCWGLRRGNPQMRGTFVSEWAEQLGEAARSSLGLRTSVLVPGDWLAGFPPASLSQPLKVFSHQILFMWKVWSNTPTVAQRFNYYILEGYPLSPAHDSVLRKELSLLIFSPT